MEATLTSSQDQLELQLKKKEKSTDFLLQHKSQAYFSLGEGGMFISDFLSEISKKVVSYF